MKALCAITDNCAATNARFAVQPSRLSRLHMVSQHELDDLRQALERGGLPLDFESKLARLANSNLLGRFIEHHCRAFIALLAAAQDHAFPSAAPATRERLLRCLAYVRKDEDANPDYKPNGFDDDLAEVRAAVVEHQQLLHEFKNWRLQHQVPALWLA